MEFHKTSERLIRFEMGHVLIRNFTYDVQTSNPIAEFMKTRFFSWKEEFRDEVNVTINSVDQLTDWNFHGLYDIKKLRPEHFKVVSPHEFVKKFHDTIKEEGEMDNNITEVQHHLNKLINLDSKFYLIDSLPDEFIHHWTVFDFFLSGFKFSEKQKELTAVECGLD